MDNENNEQSEAVSKVQAFIKCMGYDNVADLSPFARTCIAGSHLKDIAGIHAAQTHRAHIIQTLGRIQTS